MSSEVVGAQLDALLESISNPAPLPSYDELAGARWTSPVLFGAGRLGRITLSGLRRTEVTPVAFADNNPALWGHQVDGLPVLSPAEAVRRFGAETPFVVTIFTGQAVRRQLAAQRLCVVPFASLFLRYPEVFLPFGCLDFPGRIFEDRIEVLQALELWADDESRREYLAQVRYRLTLDDNLPSCLPPTTIYFPEELVPLQDGECFVDCGAFDGDSVRDFLGRRGSAFRRVVAIEPDPLNCQRLRAFVESLPPEVRPKMQVVESAVGAHTGRVRFDATGTAAAVVEPGGTLEVQCARLDELLEGEDPTYVKMDIEGAEPEALQGAREVIRRHQPVLAICLYHHQNDLWRLPLLIRSLNPDYSLFLRRYSDDCWEQVCYAVPADRLRPRR